LGAAQPDGEYCISSLSGRCLPAKWRFFPRGILSPLIRNSRQLDWSVGEKKKKKKKKKNL
jgi:hypothetical protein